MAQPVEYVYSGAFIPGTLARAEQVGIEFTSVQAGFDALAYQGVDSGAANAYVVTTSGGKCGVYSDGLVVEAKLLNGNTTSCTIAVDSGAVVGLTQPNGQSVASGAIVANNWYRLVYNSTYSAWTILAPTAATTITSNTIATSAPTHLVGLVAAGGVSTACAPIDVTFALDQSISPTWTGSHTFSGAVAFNSSVSFATGLTLTGASGAYAFVADGNASTGHSFGLEINAGTNNSDVAFLVNNQAGSTQFFEINGQGSVTVGSPTGGAQGVGTINATGLFVNGAAVKTTSISSANPTASVGLSAVNGTALTFMTSDSAPALSQAITPTWTGAHVFTPSSAVTAITIDAAVNALGLFIQGGTNTSNTYLLSLLSGQGSGFSSGLIIQAGTSSADEAIAVVNAAGTASLFRIFGDGHGILGPSTTVGAQWTTAGVFTLNASSGNPLIVNANNTTVFKVFGTTAPTVEGYGPTAAGLVDMTPDKGSATLTTVGFTVNTALGGCAWSKQGNLAVISIPAFSGVLAGNTVIKLTGLPAAIQPATITQNVMGLFGENNGNPAASCMLTITAASGTLTLSENGAGATFGSGQAGGMESAFNVAYQLQ